MPNVRWVVALLPALVVCLMVGHATAKTLSREEIDVMWEQLLQHEQYRAVEYFNERYENPTSDSPTDDRTIKVAEGRERYIWDILGLSGGGGWVIRGQLEAAIPTKERILQLYSKATSKWSPGFLIIWEPGYDPKKYPQWEFRLILRDVHNRQRIHTLKSVFLQPGDVLPTFDEKGNSIKELVGQRIPRGELRYDAARQVAVIQILGVHHPISVEIPLAQAPSPAQEKGR